MLHDAAAIEEKRDTATTPKGRMLCVRCPDLEAQLAAFITTCERQHERVSRWLVTIKVQEILAGIENPPPLKLSGDWLACFTSCASGRYAEPQLRLTLRLVPKGGHGVHP